MKKGITIYLFFLAMLITQLGYAQTISLSGTIIDGITRESLVGVSVFVKGTTLGTASNVDGFYQLNVPEGSTVVFSFIGYKTVEEVAVVTQPKLNINMFSEYEKLDEMIVIGYGTQRKTDRTGAVTQITAEELNRGSLTDPIQSLQGKAPGVMITRKGGDPNSGFSVRVRGASGFESNTEPLYVIDGVAGVDPTTIAPEDIESFNVLKDAASTAIYGSRGANGVIIITTKKGKSGKSAVNFSANYSVENIARKLNLLTADELREFASEFNLNMTDNGANTDWQDQIYRTGTSQNYNINFSGGNETSNYYSSLTHSEWNGILKGTSKERTVGKINLHHKAMDSKLTLSGSVGFAFEQNDYENYSAYNKDDVIYQALSRNPTDPKHNDDGTYFTASREFNYENPLSVINRIDNIRDAKRFMGNIKADYMILSGLTGTVNLGYLRNDDESSYFRPKDVYGAADNGSASKRYNNNSEKIMEVLLAYNKTFNNDHNFNSIIGYSWQERIYNGFNAGGANPNSDYVKYNNLGTLLDITRNDVGSYKGMSRLIGIFGRIQYNFQSKYYASASIRRDGSTKFGDNNKWGVFPTGAIGWTITEEDYMTDISWLTNLKLRASFGISGNQNIGEYNGQIYYVPSGIAINPETGQNTILYTAAKSPNPDLKWEQTSELNIGVDYALFRSRVSGSFELYSKNTTDLLGAYTVPVPPYPADRLWANSGELQNRGIELNVQFFAVDNKNFKWKTNLSASHNQQKVLDLGDYAPADGVRKEGYLSGRGLIGNNNYVSAVVEGESIGIFYLPKYEGLSQDGRFLYRSTTGGYTDEISSAQRYVAGNATPKAELGWSNNITIHNNLSFDFSLRSLLGGQIFNATRMFFDYPGLIPNLNGLPEAIDWHRKGRTSGPAPVDFYLEDATFVRLDYMAVNYRFNMDKSSIIQDLNLSFSGNNIFTITNYSGVDPETSVSGLAYGIDQYNVYPKARTFSIGLSATF